MKDLLKRIVSDPDICHGKPTIRGLRYPVETILELLGAGMSMEEILEDYEDLERDDILAVLQYASKLSKVKSIHTVATA
ncbi:Asr2172 protein [hydrothermal vent metagenome]|uniref:Asr2172 protein n=1 Tax=hydrothermal vent metagenome TaxID=652676 RepID=A0A1W1CG06_9ZZZZ